MHLRLLLLCIILNIRSVELITLRKEVRVLGERLNLLEKKHALESGLYHDQIGQILDALDGLNSSGNAYSEANGEGTTTTNRLEQEIQAKVNTTVQAIEMSVELYKNTTNKQMQAVLRGLRNEKVLRKRSAERVMDQLDNNIQKLVTTITDRFDKQDAAILELMKQVNNVSDRIDTVHELNRNLKDDITDVNDTLSHYGNQCVLDNAVVLKTIEDTANASQYHSNVIEETLKTIEGSLTNLTVTETSTQNLRTCPPDWILFSSTNSCYKLFETKVTFEDAVQHCIDLNSHITDITNDFENDFVVSLVRTEQAWVGLTDKESEDVWRWKHNNQLASYVKWRPDPPQPDGSSNQNCVILNWENRAEKQWWNDWSCGSMFGYICKMVLRQTC